MLGVTFQVRQALSDVEAVGQTSNLSVPSYRLLPFLWRDKKRLFDNQIASSANRMWTSNFNLSLNHRDTTLPLQRCRGNTSSYVTDGQKDLKNHLVQQDESMKPQIEGRALSMSVWHATDNPDPQRTHRGIRGFLAADTADLLLIPALMDGCLGWWHPQEHVVLSALLVTNTRTICTKKFCSQCSQHQKVYLTLSMTLRKRACQGVQKHKSDQPNAHKLNAPAKFCLSQCVCNVQVKMKERSHQTGDPG